MMRSAPAKAWTAWLCCALLGAASTLGCATTAQKEEREKNVKRARSHFDLAADHVSNGRIELGLRELLMAERLDPENPRIQHGLAIAYLQKGKIELAEEHMKNALRIRPDYQDARFNLAALYLNLGRYGECAEHAAILADDPTFSAPWKAYNVWGWALYEQADVKEAQVKLERARTLSPRYWPTLMNLGILEAEQGHRPEAIRHFAAVLELEPGPSATAEANYRLAEIYVSLGRREQAVGHLRMAVVKAPSDPWGRKSEEYLKLLR
jgi:type IV pilus assembly protein PilF